MGVEDLFAYMERGEKLERDGQVVPELHQELGGLLERYRTRFGDKEACRTYRVICNVVMAALEVEKGYRYEYFLYIADGEPRIETDFHCDDGYRPPDF